MKKVKFWLVVIVALSLCMWGFSLTDIGVVGQWFGCVFDIAIILIAVWCAYKLDEEDNDDTQE